MTQNTGQLNTLFGGFVGKKSAPACTKLKEKDTFIFEIGYLANDVVRVDHVIATGVEIEDDVLVIWDDNCRPDNSVAAFKNWVFYRKVPSPSGE